MELRKGMWQSKVKVTELRQKQNYVVVAVRNRPEEYEEDDENGQVEKKNTNRQGTHNEK